MITPELLTVLDRLHALLAGPEPRWADAVADLARRGRAVLPPEGERELLRDVLALLAGAGSLNDLVLQDRTGVLPGNAELDALRRSLYDAAVAGL